ncbi:MAG: Ig-like domain-containing protein [Verrucomicrobia bacterium]|jgi:hypothetical protein|nr:Ig-like domain-containing protein [Verrucomicrobiota bacterium]MBT7065908.1 Ig-like domain-containing protein [Verrucomicrobiota bacterium]MBT7701221.1 Ig-like domain-containing protein [Verrucomicrobiota bacterium]
MKRTKNSLGIGIAVMAAAMMLGFVLDGRASLLVYEGFQYNATGDNLYQQPNDPGATDTNATGLAGTWADLRWQTAGMRITGGSLTFGDLPTSGNYVKAAGTTGEDNASRALTGGAQTTLSGSSEIWFSIMIGVLESSSVEKCGFALVNQPLSTQRIPDNTGAGLIGFAIGSDGGSDFRAYAWNGTGITTGSAELTTGVGTYLLVGHISFDTGTAGSDVYKLYNYSLNGGSVVGGSLTQIGATIEVDADQATLDTVALTRQRLQHYDELRIGTTLDSVLGIPDTQPPQHIPASLFPSNNATEISVTTPLQLSFDEAIAKGSGSITIREVSGDAPIEIINVSSSIVDIVNATNLVVTRGDSLGFGTNYWVDIPAGTVADLAGNPFAGITNSSQWNFTTAAALETEPPDYTLLSPTNTAAGIALTETKMLSSSLTITFDEFVQAGSGSVEIRNVTGGALVETIPLVYPDDFSGATVTIAPTGPFAFVTEYYVAMSNGVIEDLAGNPFAGISNSTQWSFTTEVDDLIPVPNMMAFSIPPAPASDTSISMSAVTAVDDTEPIEYFFSNTVSGNVSDWITSTNWTDSPLDGGSYGYQVKARDAVSNETAWSSEAFAFTPSTPASWLFVYEGFQYYSVGQVLAGQPDDAPSTDTDATGLQGTWSDANTPEMYIAASSLSFGDLPVSGNHISFNSNINDDRLWRLLTPEASNSVSSATELWFSLLVQNADDLGEGFVLGNKTVSQPKIHLNDGTDGLQGFGLGADGDKLKPYAWNGAALVAGDATTSFSGVQLVVGKIVFDAGTGGTDQYTLYDYQLNDGSVEGGTLDPIASTIEVDVDQSQLSTVNLTRQKRVPYDELRIGPTLEAVLGFAPIPAIPAGTVLIIR